jgi:hypothetical protein
MFYQLLAQADIGTIDGIGAYLPSQAGGTGTGGFQLENILTMIVGFLTIAAGLAFLVYFLVGAISWLTAGGDTKKVDDAKHYMTNGAIGMIIIVAAYSIIWIVGTVLGLNILNPAATLDEMWNPMGIIQWDPSIPEGH